MRHLSSFARVIVYDKRGTGLSDPFIEMPSVEERIDDTRAVMDAVGSDRAVVFGCSEGATLAAFFAATYPERVSSAVLYGSFARLTPDSPDYPWGFDDYMMSVLTKGAEEAWGEGVILTVLGPSFLKDDQEREWWGGYERTSNQPARPEPHDGGQRGARHSRHPADDPRPDAAPPPHGGHASRRGRPVHGGAHPGRPADRDGGGRPLAVGWRPGRGLRPRPGVRHRQPPRAETDRVLATVLFTDIVGSTERASEIGDRRWRELLEEHEQAFRRELERQGGSEVKTTGDGPRHLRRPARRSLREAATSAIRALGMTFAPASTPGNASAERRHRRHRGPHRRPRDVPRPNPVRCSCRTRSRTSRWAPTSSSRSAASTSQGRPGLLAPLRRSLRR